MRAVFFVCTLYALASHAHAQCRPSHYNIEGNLKAENAVMRISIHPSDLTVNNLICIAQTLEQQHPTWESASINFFPSREAAKNFTPGGMDLPPSVEKARKQLRATYVLNRGKHEEYLEILPFGSLTHPSRSTRINLPVKGTPHCRFEVLGRCLMALEYLDFPDEALKDFEAGKVTLQGQVTPLGKITNILVLQANVSQNHEGKLLIGAAEHNLASWQLEPRKRRDVIRITYSYIIDRSLGQFLMDTDFDLPNEIVIRGNPPPEGTPRSSR